MSTVRTNTLSNAAGSASVPVDTVISGSAKAWVNFNGTGTVAIRASFNVSSITDNGTGDYTVNFTTAMPDANYVAVFCSTVSTTGSGNTAFTPNLSGSGTTSKTSLACRIWTKQGSVLVDTDLNDVTVFR